jgi:hypothetical protein
MSNNYNSNPNHNTDTDNKIKEIKNQVNETTEIMKKNIDAVIERGEKLSILEDRTDDLAKEAKLFHGGARTLKRNMCMKNAKLIGIIACIIITIILIIVLAIYSRTKK